MLCCLSVTWQLGLEYALIISIIWIDDECYSFFRSLYCRYSSYIIGFIQEPQMAIYVAIIMLVAQQIESNLITPNVMGRSLDIHPLTVITIILAAGNIAGLWGIILAIPTYAVIKKIILKKYMHTEKL